MKNLMKYELRKTLFTKEILLGVTAAAEIAFLLGLYLEKRNLLGIAVFLLTCLAIGGVMVFGLQSVLTLHRDMNTKQSYMLFMTPNSSFKILGSKVLENGLSILLTGACFFALGALDVTLLFAKEGTLQELWDAIERLLHSINENIEITGAGMACFTLSLLASWICIVTTAYLAVVISSALLNGKRFNGLLRFVRSALDGPFHLVGHIARHVFDRGRDGGVRRGGGVVPVDAGGEDGGDDRQDDERGGGVLGDHFQLALNALGLVFVQEGFGRAADGAQAGAVALLHQHGHDDNQRDQHQQYVDDRQNYTHW